MAEKLHRAYQSSVLESRYFLRSTGHFPQQDFKSAVPESAHRRIFGAHSFAFLSLVLLNYRLASMLGYNDGITYLVDRGPFADQLTDAHLAVIGWENEGGKPLLTGALDFDSDDNNSALQAADVIAWATRRKLETGKLSREFSPLEDIFRERYNRAGRLLKPHLNFSVPRDGVDMLGKSIVDWIIGKGSPPTTSDLGRK